MKRLNSFSLFLLIITPAFLLGEAPREQWIAVTAPAFRDALEPLCVHRQAQGMRVRTVVTTEVFDSSSPREGAAIKLRDRLHRLCRDFSGTSYVLLVGALSGSTLADTSRMVLPALHGTTGRMKGLPTDNGYGLPGADLLATVAVGRLPARTVAEARGMIQKTLDQERDTRPGTWRRRLMVLAGAPEFNPLVDSLVERLAIAQLARIDLTWHGQALYQNPQSRFSLPADLCRERARAYLQQGQALTLYLGHSNAQGFFAGGHRYLDRHDWAELTIPRGRGILATFGCKGCQLSGPDGEGYGLAAIRNPQGPVAVIGSHGICFAAMVKLASEAFTESFLGHDPPQRLGACWLRLKHGLARRNMDSITFRLLDAVDGDSRIPQDRQRREHQEMFLLLGDPALRLPSLPPDLKLEVAAPTTSGNIIKVKGAAPARLEGARVCLTLERPLDSDPPGGTALPAGSPAARSLAMRERHERANRFILATQEAFIKQGRFEGHLALPAQLPWAYIVVRAYAATERQEGLGVLRKEVKTPEPDKGS